MLVTIISLPSLAFAYGEGWRDDLPLYARQQLLLTNEARTDPQAALADCPESICKDKRCYVTAPLTPYYETTVLGRLSALGNMLQGALYEEKGVFISNSNYTQHSSHCKLVDNIAKIFPADCHDTSCACVEHKIADKDTKETDAAVRFKLFNIDAGENMSASTLNHSKLKPDPGYFLFSLLLNEEGGFTDTCKYHYGDGAKNGHRTAILSSLDVYEANQYYILTTMNAWYGAYYKPNDDKGAAIIVHNFGKSQNGTDYRINDLTAGSHYTKNGTLWFKTHYHSEVDVSKVMLSIGDQCIELKKTVGKSKTAVFGTDKFKADDLKPCTPYFYESVDTDGNRSRYPTRGSLLYIPTELSKTVYCDAKTWQPDSPKSCISGLKCKVDEHEYNGKCEKDSIAHCGAHDYNCEEQIPYWADGECKLGLCVASKCSSKAHILGELCEKNTVAHCGSHGYSCAKNNENWAYNTGSACADGGVCIPVYCKSGYHPEDNQCVPNTEGLKCKVNQYEYKGKCMDSSVEHCGSNSYSCSKYVEGWKDGTCPYKFVCKATACQDGYELEGSECVLKLNCNSAQHIYNNTCEPNNLSNCGAHGYVCKDNVDDWKNGSCQAGECIISECIDGKELKNGKCVNKTTKCKENQHQYQNSCENDSIENCGEHGKSCIDTIHGWNDGSCTNGLCTLKSCISGMHINNNKCVENTIQCDNNQHEYEDACENDSIENCGEHGNKCTDIKGWKDGSCSDGVCNATECTDDMKIIDGKCSTIETSDDDDVLFHPEGSDGCSGHPVSHNHFLPWLIMLGLFSLFLKRRDRINHT